MAKTKEQKKSILNELKDRIAAQKAIVFIDFSNVESKALFKLRDELKAKGGTLEVVKKTLLKKVLQGLKEKDLAKKIDEVKGQLALAFGFEDEVSPAKVCYGIQKENENLKILGGVLGSEYQTKERVMELAQLPSRQDLLARLLGSLSSPVSRFVYVLRANLNNLVSVLSEIQKVK